MRGHGNGKLVRSAFFQLLEKREKKKKKKREIVRQEIFGELIGQTNALKKKSSNYAQ